MPRAKGQTGDNIKLDPEQFEKLASIGATQHEAAHFLGVSPATVEGRLMRPEFRAAWDRGMSNLKLSLRRQQVKLADTGNVTMLIWLGKNLLGQRDNLDSKLTGGGPNGELEVIDGTPEPEFLSHRIAELRKRRADSEMGTEPITPAAAGD